MHMSLKLIARRTKFDIALTLGLLASSAVLASAPAFAGACPVDQVAENAMEAGATMPEGVTDDVLSSIDLSSKGEAWKGSLLRMRKLVVQPGGIVPWHSHEARPANILVVEGSITEYSSNCKVPIEHKAGDVTAEFGALSHWWKNNGKDVAVLYSADILSPEVNHDEAM
jgi:quercetin dioxygenase-like cupin family protein